MLCIAESGSMARWLDPVHTECSTTWNKVVTYLQPNACEYYFWLCWPFCLESENWECHCDKSIHFLLNNVCFSEIVEGISRLGVCLYCREITSHYTFLDVFNHPCSKQVLTQCHCENNFFFWWWGWGWGWGVPRVSHNHSTCLKFRNWRVIHPHEACMQY